jgi:GWxTD domain-containing protein
MNRSLPGSIAAVGLVALAACTTYVPVAGGDNLAYLYGKGAAAVRLDARVHRTDSTHATLYFKLRTADLLYKNAGDGGRFQARATIHYETFRAGMDKPVLVDSATTLVTDQRTAEAEDRELIGSMHLRLDGPAPLDIRITAHDLNRDAETMVLGRVEDAQRSVRPYFLPLDAKGLPLFEDHVPPRTEVHLRAEAVAGRTLFVTHYPPTDRLPPPVFAEAAPAEPFNVPDSSFQLTADKNGLLAWTSSDSGHYLIRTDTNAMNGYNLFVAEGSFPLVSTVSDMAGPLRYITSSKEWAAISATSDPRKAIEKFWLGAAGDRTRAREAIAAYYGRVEAANRHFTACMDGWKTDRGLVHIIFGTPTTIRRSTDGNMETWTYGEETNLMSLNFRFLRKPSPFCGDQFVLQRDPALRSAWYRNVESWRNARFLQN